MEWYRCLSEVVEVSDHHIAAWEELVGRKLPADYLEVVKVFSGYAPQPGGVRVGRRGVSVVGPLFHLDPDVPSQYRSYGPHHWLEALKEWDFVDESGPCRYVPFAHNTGGLLYCFDFSHAEPTVVAVDMMYDVNEDQSVLPVADSFTDLLGKFFS